MLFLSLSLDEGVESSSLAERSATGFPTYIYIYIAAAAAAAHKRRNRSQVGGGGVRILSFSGEGDIYDTKTFRACAAARATREFSGSVIFIVESKLRWVPLYNI